MKSDDKLIRTVNSYKILIDNQCDLIKEYPDGTREKIGGKDISKVSELENDANYQNAEQVNSAIDEATSTLATKDELNNGLSSKADKSEIPTNNNELTNGAGYVTQSAIDTSISGKADASDIPTNNNQLDNGAGYVTQSAIDASISGKADRSELPVVNNAKITITQGGATKGSFTLNQANEDTIEIDAGGNVDLTNYLTFTAEEAGAEIHLDKSADDPSLSAVLEYDLGDGNWQNYAWDVTSGLVITLANVGDKVRFRGDNTQFSNSYSNYYEFEMTKKIAGSGSVMTLLDKTNKLRDLTGKKYCFANLFYGCSSLTTAPELPATTLADSCYSSMFSGCNKMKTAPELPATTLADSCYNNMFSGCSSLTQAPNLPATTLANYCYSSMFYGCTNLTQAPELPATTLSYKCYDQMFYRCSSLTQAPELPATTLATGCYNSMFWDCSSLNYINITYTGADNPGAFRDWLGNVLGPGYFICPEGFPKEQIPSGWTVSHKTDIDTSYELAHKMSNPTNAGIDGQVLTKTADAYEWKDAAGGGSVDLTNYLTFTAEEAGATIALDKSADVPSLSAVLEYDLGDDNWQNYTWNTTSGQVITLANVGDKVRFRGDNVKLNGENVWAMYYQFKMTKKIAGSGSIMTLIDKKDELRDLTGKDQLFLQLFMDCKSLITAPELPATKLCPACYMQLFYQCTNLTQAPELPAKILFDSCYNNMFSGCASLTKAPKLPATTLVKDCYSSMFYGCTSLTKAPELPATTLADSCYSSMFYGCTSLTKAPELPATTLATWCYSFMFYGCSSLTQAPNLPATTLAKNCYNSMFYGCTSLTKAPELPATTLVDYCYQSMFYKCTSLNYINIAYSGPDNSGAFNNWLLDVPGPGIFVCNEGFPANRIPAGWEVSHKTDIDTSYELANKVNGSGLTIWTGTQQEYDGLTTKDANTLYMIKEA